MESQRFKLQQKAKEEKLMEKFESEKEEIGKGVNENIKRKLNEN